ncbi:MAG: hypothetical protein D6688_01870 [Alphaproteobacteria bacterium]|nr:MAG: hypothetical protein D6688_01870 [Alphaproteobacteria bacterium]
MTEDFDDAFNMSLRKFLKQVGVTSQRAVETALREAAAAGRAPKGPLRARMVLTVEGLDLTHTVEGTLETGGDS